MVLREARRPLRERAGRESLDVSRPDPDRTARPRRAPLPCFRPNRGEKLFCAPARRAKSLQKTRQVKGLLRSVAALPRARTGERKHRNSAAKSDNRGGTGWIRAVWRHTARSPFIGRSRAAEYAANLAIFLSGGRVSEGVRHRRSVRASRRTLWVLLRTR
jgi:hypothetical protein